MKPILLVSLLIVSIGTLPVSAAADQQACPTPAKECARQIRAILSGGKFLGVKVDQTSRGLIITNVVQDSAAQRAGLRVGDRVIAVNGHDCTSATVRAFKQIVAATDDGRRIAFTVERGGYFKIIEARMEMLTSDQIEKIVAAHMLKAHSSELTKPKGQ